LLLYFNHHILNNPWEDCDLPESDRFRFIFNEYYNKVMTKMKEKYFIWISENYPTPESAILQCESATKKMVKQFPELKRVRGMIHVREPHGLNPTKSPHWWLVTPDGKIIDPVIHQYPLGIIKYIPLDESLGTPTGKCMNCGDFCYNNNIVCSKKCGEILSGIYNDLKYKCDQ
jgi:hypothetical protein